RPQVVEGRCQLVEVGARADDERDPLGLRARALDEVGDLADQRRRQVVDDEPAEVLERVGRLAATRARQPGDDQELAQATFAAASVTSRDRGKRMWPGYRPPSNCRSGAVTNSSSDGFEWSVQRDDADPCLI